MPRKSVAAEKRAQIVDAFCDCVIDLGMDKSSMGEVAARVGIDRSTMHYYFKTREALVIEASNHIAKFYVDRMHAAVERLNPADRVKSLVEFLFGPNFHDERRSALLDELGTLGNRQPFFREQVRSIYLSLEEVIIGIFGEGLPDMPEKERADLVYALMAMVEGATVLMGMGMAKSRRLSVRRVALSLLEQSVTRAAN